MNEYTRKLLDKTIDTIESVDLLVDHEKTDVGIVIFQKIPVCVICKMKRAYRE